MFQRLGTESDWQGLDAAGWHVFIFSDYKPRKYHVAAVMWLVKGLSQAMGEAGQCCCFGDVLRPGGQEHCQLLRHCPGAAAIKDFIQATSLRHDVLLYWFQDVKGSASSTGASMGRCDGVVV
jgi:hypothetical protein